MRTLVLVSFLLVALSGCVDEPESNPVAEAETTAPSNDDQLSYEVDPDSANETELMDAHEHDEWGGVTELVLMDSAVTTGDCTNPFTALFLTGAGLFTDQEAQVGCASWRLDDGIIVPEGTGALRIEVDASDALDAGGMQLSYDNEYINFTQLDATTDKEFIWRTEMTPLEWDLPHSTETSWFFILRPDGSPSVLDGEIQVFIVAEQMENWSPILGSAHIDHWAPDANHDFINERVYKALDINTTINMPSFADRAGTRNTNIDRVPLTDIVAPNSNQVSLVAVWDAVSGCPPGHGCWPVVSLSTPGGRGFSFAEPVDFGENYAIYLYDVPQPLAPDSTYATDSVYSVSGFVRACPNGEVQETPVPFVSNCWGEAVATMSVDTWLEVEVWKSAVDMAGLKSRMGIA